MAKKAHLLVIAAINAIFIMLLVQAFLPELRSRRTIRLFAAVNGVPLLGILLGLGIVLFRHELTTLHVFPLLLALLWLWGLLDPVFPRSFRRNAALQFLWIICWLSACFGVILFAGSLMTSLGLVTLLSQIAAHAAFVFRYRSVRS